MIDFAALISSTKAALDMAKSAKDVSDQHQAHAAVIGVMEQLAEVHSKLADTQAEYQSLLEEVERLRGELDNKARFDDYRMEKTPMGGYILPLRDEYVTDDRPPHAICHPCKEDGRLSVLTETEYRYVCPSCQYTAGKKPSPRFNRRRGARVVHPGFS